MPAPYSDSLNDHYGKFATTSRLIACLVTESLVSAYYVPNKAYNPATSSVKGICVLLRVQGSGEARKLSSALALDDILVVVPLRGLPELSADKTTVNGITCTKINLVDPWDMLPHLYAPENRCNAYKTILPDSQITRQQVDAVLGALCGAEPSQNWLVDGYDAVQLWQQFGDDFGVADKLNDQIASELASSMLHQTYTYDNPQPLPTLNSPSYIWEQSIVEGHATHPMHKARKSFPPMPPLNPGQENLKNPPLRLIAVPKSSINMRGDFEQLAMPLTNAMLAKTNTPREKYEGHVLIPVHYLQVPNIQDKFADAIVLPEANSVTVESLTSIRSVAAPSLLPGLAVKLCLGVKISSALRTITPFTTYFGPGFSYDVVPKLTYDHDVLTIEREVATVVYKHEDFDVAKHCACVLRDAVEYPAQPSEDDDCIVVCAALVEKIQKPDTDETLLSHVWGLDTEEKRIAFMDRYIELALKAFLPPALVNGVAFEAHGQNTLARFDRKTGELKGFVIRDFGGVKVHNETLKRSAGVEIDVLPDSCVVAETLDEVYKLLYHTLIHSQLQRMNRVLNLHHNGKGWELLRKHLGNMIPRDHPMWTVFMESEKVPGKCLVRMKIEELYRDYIYRPVPNVIQCRPQEA